MSIISLSTDQESGCSFFGCLFLKAFPKAKLKITAAATVMLRLNWGSYTPGSLCDCGPVLGPLVVMDTSSLSHGLLDSVAHNMAPSFIHRESVRG